MPILLPGNANTLASAGMETKLNKSAVKPRAKISKVEKTTNSLIIILLLVQILMCILIAVLYGNWLAVSATDVTFSFCLFYSSL